jgi:hypothetical protein
MRDQRCVKWWPVILIAIKAKEVLKVWVLHNLQRDFSINQF